MPRRATLLALLIALVAACTALPAPTPTLPPTDTAIPPTAQAPPTVGPTPTPLIGFAPPTPTLAPTLNPSLQPPPTITPTPLITAPAPESPTVGRYQVYEATLNYTSDAYKNPWDDASLTVTFNAPGAARLTAIADFNNVVDESNENNNIKSLDVVLIKPTPLPVTSTATSQ